MKYQIRLQKWSGKPWKAPESRDGDYLKTLHEWGALPEVSPVVNVARLFAALSGQNPAAIELALKEAIENQEIRFYAWGDDSWKENNFSLGQDALVSESVLHYDLAIENAWTLNWDAMGVRPADAVLLLMRRGRKVPDELRAFLRESEPQETTAALAAPAEGRESEEDRQDRRLTRFKALGGELCKAGSSWHARGKRGALSRLVKEEQRAGQPYRQRVDVKKDLEAAAGRREASSA